MNALAGQKLSESRFGTVLMASVFAQEPMTGDENVRNRARQTRLQCGQPVRAVRMAGRGLASSPEPLWASLEH